MPKFFVSIPIAGAIGTVVEATDKKAAIDAAWEEFNERGADNFEIEWEALDRISTGNILHAPQNEVLVSSAREET